MHRSRGLLSQNFHGFSFSQVFSLQFSACLRSSVFQKIKVGITKQWELSYSYFLDKHNNLPGLRLHLYSVILHSNRSRSKSFCNQFLFFVGTIIYQVFGFIFIQSSFIPIGVGVFAINSFFRCVKFSFLLDNMQIDLVPCLFD